MRLKRHVPLLESTRKTVAARPLVAAQWLPPHCPRCRSSSSTAADPERIAVLGGGIAGLSSAYYVSKQFPKSKVTLFEAGKETGGWIKSRRVAVPGGNVLFESGPRSLRNSTPTAALIQELGLVEQLTYTKKSNPGAQNRYIYYPDQLNKFATGTPTAIDVFSLWRSGILGGVLGLPKEPLMPKRPDSMTDETVGSFIARRVDKRIADNIVSAVFHGIYAGDIWQLSAKTLLGLPWNLEARYGNVLGGFFKMQGEQQTPEQVFLVHPYDRELAKAMNAEIDLDLDFAMVLKEASIFTFKDGLQTLVRALQSALEGNENVDIRTETPAQSFEPTDGPGVQIVSGNPSSPQTETFDFAISTLRAPDLTPYVTVMTVNLYYQSPSLLPVEGFGYLIPQSVPFEQNPERALGVIFDSSAIRGQDTVGGTKLTVMLGGHWWNGWTGYPSEEEGLEMAKAVVKRHLNISDEPLAHAVNLSRDCIPQYTLGYNDRLLNFAEGMTKKFQGRMRFVGSQFNGVGVNDCITGAWNMSRELRDGGWKSQRCGLGRVMDRREWVVATARDMAYVKRESAEAMGQ